MLEILRHPYVKSGAGHREDHRIRGAAVETLSIDERATMTNMAAEVGGFTGFIAPDEKHSRLPGRGSAGCAAEAARALLRGADVRSGRRCTRRSSRSTRPRCGRCSRSRAIPGTGCPIDELGAPVRVDIAYAGSAPRARRKTWTCTPGSCARRRTRGERVAPWCPLLHPVRLTGREALLRGSGLFGAVPGGGARPSSSHPAARASTRARGCRYDREERDHQRDQPQLPRPFRARAALPRQPLHDRGQRAGRANHGVGAGTGAGLARGHNTTRTTPRNSENGPAPGNSPGPAIEARVVGTARAGL